MLSPIMHYDRSDFMFRFESTGTMATCCTIFSLFLLIFVADLSFSAKDIDANTIALWTFDEAKGNTAADLSEKGHNLKVEGKSKWVKGKFGNALWFDKDAFVAHNPGKAIDDFSFENASALNFGLTSKPSYLKQFLAFLEKKGNMFQLSAKKPKDGGWIPISTMGVGSKLHRGMSATMENGTIMRPLSMGKKLKSISTASRQSLPRLKAL